MGESTTMHRIGGSSENSRRTCEEGQSAGHLTISYQRYAEQTLGEPPSRRRGPALHEAWYRKDSLIRKLTRSNRASARFQRFGYAKKKRRTILCCDGTLETATKVRSSASPQSLSHHQRTFLPSVDPGFRSPCGSRSLRSGSKAQPHNRFIFCDAGTR